MFFLYFNKESILNRFFCEKIDVFFTTLLLFVLSPILIYLLFHISDRYLIPYSVVIQLIVAVWVGKLIYAIEYEKSRILAFFVCIAISLISVLFFNRPTIGNVLAEEHGSWGFSSAGEWLYKNVENSESLKIAAPKKGHVTLRFMSDLSKPILNRSGRYMEVRGILPDEVIKRMKNRKIKYLVLDKYHTSIDAVELWPLFEGKYVSNELKLVKKGENGFFVIYKLINDP